MVGMTKKQKHKKQVQKQNRKKIGGVNHGGKKESKESGPKGSSKSS